MAGLVKRVLMNFFFAQDNDYFTESEDDPRRVQNMTDMDRLAELLSLASLQDLNKELTCGDRAKAEEAFNKQVVL